MTPPGAGKPEIKTIEGHLCKYCARCLKWFWGTRAHLTAEHVVGAGRSPQPATQQAQLVATNVALAPNSAPPVPPVIVTPAPGRTAPPLDPVVVDLMTDEARRAERINWSASLWSAFTTGTPAPRP